MYFLGANKNSYASTLAILLFSVSGVLFYAADAAALNCFWINFTGGCGGGSASCRALDAVEDVCALMEGPFTTASACGFKNATTPVRSWGAQTGNFSVTCECSTDSGGSFSAPDRNFNCAYSQAGYYSQGGYYGQGSYYSQGSYYGQGSYYSQGSYAYSQASYYSQAGYVVPPSGTITAIPNPTSTIFTSGGSPAGTIAGTATAGSGTVSLVQIVIRRFPITGPGPCDDWNGSAWTTACTPLNTTFTGGLPNTTWTYSSVPPLASLTNGQNYRVYLLVGNSGGTTNNWATFQDVVFQTTVNYVTDSLATAPGGLTAGQSVTFSSTVRNSGTGGSATVSSTRLRIDINNDSTYDVLPANQSTAGLAAGGTEVETWPGAWTATVGTHRFEVCVDNTSLIVESSEVDNCTTSTFIVTSGINYISESLSTTPGSLVAGATVTFNGTVRNSGTGGTGTSSFTRARLDIDNNGTWDILPINQTTTGLAAGATQAEVWSSVWTAVAGTHRLEVCADITGLLAESDETDNCASLIFSVGAGIDYIAQGLASSPGGLTSGLQVSFSATVRNSGAGNSTIASQTRVRLDVGNNGTWDVLPANQPTAALAAGATEVETWFNVWTATIGTHLFEVCVDDGNLVTEVNELNNCTTQTFTVTAGINYISQSLIASPAGLYSGQQVTLSGVIRNTGTDSTGTVSQTRLRIDVGDNGTWDVLPLNQSTAGLGIGATETEIWTNVWTVTAGTHRFEVCADITTLITESSEVDNCTTQTFAVNAVPVIVPGSVRLDESNYCTSGTGGFISWTFSDPDVGDTQSQYQIEIATDVGFTNIIFSNTFIGSNTSYPIPAGTLAWNTTYSARVRVWDSKVPPAVSNYEVMSVCNGPGCDPTPPQNFWTTPVHAYPNPVVFSWSPNQPIINQSVSFHDNSPYSSPTSFTTCVGGCSSWNWTFSGGNPGSSGLQSPASVFTTIGNHTINLTVTDDAGHSCSAASQTINIQRPIPLWKEIIPFDISP